MATVGAVSNMQTNRLCLTLIDPNVYYDPVKVVKTHMPYMEIGDDLVAQLKTTERTFVILTVTPTRKKIRVVQHDEYGVYRDEDGNAQIVDGRIIKVSKEDIKAILEMADKSGKHYLSLLRYEGCFQIPGIHPTPLIRQRRKLSVEMRSWR
ncbi:hypothetical protein DY000_02053040 [Brassica cretica]|uniref:Uncharacterized protein n=1 Tax=Brassica cretica TaxID=69181 RepID=A0ABQ7ACL9_BRACR|nr:hypothetical protein DY000_02053040 [Brassica cretica]